MGEVGGGGGGGIGEVGMGVVLPELLVSFHAVCDCMHARASLFC